MKSRLLPCTAVARIFTAAFCLGAAAQVRAVDIFWDNGSGADSNWNTAANWNPDGVPGAADPADVAVFDAGLPAAAISGTVPDVSEVRFQNASGTVNQTDGMLNVTNQFRMGVTPTAPGAYNLSGGQINALRFFIAEGSGSDSTITVSGGTLNQRDAPNGENQAVWNRVGVNSGSNGTINLSAGTISLYARTLIGGAGTATVNQTGGVFEVREGEFNVADTNSTATYNLSAGVLRTLNPVRPASVGQWDNSTGLMNVSGTGEADFAGRFYVGFGQAGVPTSGTVNQTGGTVRLRRGFTVADANMATGVYTLDAGSLRQEDVPNPNVDTDQTGWNFIGRNGAATFNLSGGTASFDARTFIGQGPSGNATVTQTGGLFEVRRSELIIGDTGTAVYNISAGTLQTVGGHNINVGNWNGGNGQLNISGTAEVISSAGMTIGQAQNNNFSAIGVVTQSGGRVQLASGLQFGNASANASGTYNLNGGILDLTGDGINKEVGSATFNFTGGRLQDLAGYNIGNLAQRGGILSPGAVGAAGFTTINGNYSLDAGATLEISILDSLTSDFFFVNGTLTLGGDLSIVDDAPGLPLGSSYFIVANDDIDPIAGFFAGKPEGSAFGSAAGNFYRISYFGGDGNDVSLLTVPEPAAGALLLGSAGMIALCRRRK